MSYFEDLRAFLITLEENGKLNRITTDVIKETQMAPLVMLQYRGLTEPQWRSFLFEKVVGVTGKRYANRVLMGYPASRQITALGLGCEPDEINKRWSQGCSHPIEPVMVPTGPVHEVVIEGDQLEQGGLEDLGVPIEVPGFSGNVRTTTQVVTKDPETGIRNVGQYSGHFSGRSELRLASVMPHHLAVHHIKWRERGERMPVAIVIGAIPNLTLAAASPLPYGMDEYAFAGGMVGEPMKLVKCKTVDLEVPATAEMVIEGVMTETMEAHAAFGDYPGYVYEVGNRYVPIMKVTAITHRQNPIFTHYDIGYPTTACTVLDSIAIESALYHHLKHASHQTGVLDVAGPYAGSGRNMIVIQMRKIAPWDPWQALNALAGYEAAIGKISIVVDEDINPRDPDAVNWALSFRMQPHRDVRIITQRSPLLDVSAYPPNSDNAERYYPSPSGSSAMLIDATRKWDYAPVGLPKKEYMEDALRLWEQQGLPKLQLKEPWYGYHLGLWRDEDEENAQSIVHGEYQELWKRLNKTRRPLAGPFK